MDGGLYQEISTEPPAIRKKIVNLQLKKEIFTIWKEVCTKDFCTEPPAKKSNDCIKVNNNQKLVNVCTKSPNTRQIAEKRILKSESGNFPEPPKY